MFSTILFIAKTLIGYTAKLGILAKVKTLDKGALNKCQR